MTSTPYAGTILGPDGKRYPAGTTPPPYVPDHVAEFVHGTPAAGDVPVWNPTTRRLEWGTPAAGSSVGVGVGHYYRAGTSRTSFATGGDDFITWNNPPAHLVGDTFARDAADHTRIIVSRAVLVAVLATVYWGDSGHTAGTRYMEILVNNSSDALTGIIEDSVAATEGTIQNVELFVPMSPGDYLTLDIGQGSGVTLDPVYPVVQLTAIAALS